MESELIALWGEAAVGRLATVAGILAFLAAIHTLQALGLLPYFVGPFAVRGFSLWNAFMWGLMVWVYAWLVQMLWRVDPQAWLFLAVITVFNLVLDFTFLLGTAHATMLGTEFTGNGLQPTTARIVAIVMAVAVAATFVQKRLQQRRG